MPSPSGTNKSTPPDDEERKLNWCYIWGNISIQDRLLNMQCMINTYYVYQSKMPVNHAKTSRLSNTLFWPN
jgi:hypothetical protein